MTAKIKKNKLEIEYSYDFELVGVRTSLKGYQLAWHLNKILSGNLIRQKNFALHLKKGPNLSFDHFSFKSPMNELHLFKNKTIDTEGATTELVPEFPHFDFVLMTQSEESLSGNRLQEYLRHIPSVELAALIPLASLKSKDNFIF
ncbi:MAG: IPExxxVDY family protein [Cyclobacteriaceae bacterium]|nr:IPExxxVDY family protein [Cyclobacteriaceae bacterium]